MDVKKTLSQIKLFKSQSLSSVHQHFNSPAINANFQLRIDCIWTLFLFSSIPYSLLLHKNSAQKLFSLLGII